MCFSSDGIGIAFGMKEFGELKKDMEMGIG
jgi:hypothetical protein